jgi:amidase
MTAKRPFPLIQTVPVPQGDQAFEAKRAELLNNFIDKVPEEYYIPQHYVDNPPRDVTAIPRECGILTELDLEITESYDAVGLAGAIAQRKYTAVDVATAFLKRAIICDQISCCLTQWMPEIALAQVSSSIRLSIRAYSDTIHRLKRWTTTWNAPARLSVLCTVCR